MSLSYVREKKSKLLFISQLSFLLKSYFSKLGTQTEGRTKLIKGTLRDCREKGRRSHKVDGKGEEMVGKQRCLIKLFFLVIAIWCVMGILHHHKILVKLASNC